MGLPEFQAACDQDLEGVVARYKWGSYRPDPTLSSRVKIKTPAYSRAAGRNEEFTRYRRFSPGPITPSITHSAAGGD